jgi:hypothetical protein
MGWMESAAGGASTRTGAKVTRVYRITEDGATWLKNAATARRRVGLLR